MTAESRTPEGRILRAARRRARLSIRDAARRASMSEDWWGAIERGYESKNAEKAVRPLPDILARMVSVLDITDDERAELIRLNPAAEDDLAGMAAQAAADPDLDAAADDMFDALTRNRPDREVIGRIWWRSFTPEGKLMPLGDRMRRVTEWANRPRGGEADDAAVTG